MKKSVLSRTKRNIAISLSFLCCTFFSQAQTQVIHTENRIFSSDIVLTDVSQNMQYISSSCTKLYRLRDELVSYNKEVVQAYPFSPCYLKVESFYRIPATYAYVYNGERTIMLIQWVEGADHTKQVAAMGSRNNRERNNQILHTWLDDEIPLQIATYDGFDIKLNRNITIID